MRILLVEDEVELQRLIIRLVRRGLDHDAVVVATDNLVEAWEQLSGPTPFDLVIMDGNLPDGNGWDLVVRLEGRYRVLGISADRDALEQLRRAGCALTLEKPFSIDDLLTSIQTLHNGEEPSHASSRASAMG